ncbi:MAG: formylmethanofuran dehydrogenase subunit C [Methanomicrobiales archaeon]|nr:formylmethanofuran dehydrogenase subunit C [Methanomicrobiales archaeon]
MDIVKLTLNKIPDLYIEAENITPDHFAGKTAQQIGELHLHLGNTTAKISDYFSVEGKGGQTAADTKIIVAGDTTKVKYIGMKMTAGEIEVQGNTDMYTAAWMSGGKIHVKGNVDSFCAIGMTGGEFIVDGNAKNYLAASYRGDWRGMQGGKVTVKGNAGSDTATFMNGGTIDIGGNVDVHLGTHAEGGKIIVRGNAKGRVGGQMVKGDIFVLGQVERMMPSYIYKADEEVELDGKKQIFQVWIGDMGERHAKRKGEIIYGKIYIPTEIATEKAYADVVEKKKKLSDKQLDQVKEAFRDQEPTVQQVRTYIYDTFDVDMKPMQVSRVISGLKR